jgi:peptide/nickel transport system ATP-binding protein
MSQYILETENLKKHYPIKSGVLGTRIVGSVRALDGVDVRIRRNETYALVGESGCGKTTFGKAVLRIIDPTGGKVVFDGRDISTETGESLRQLRRRFQMIFQDTVGSLNPKKRVKDLIAAPLWDFEVGDKEAQHRRVSELLALVGLSSGYLYRYPSGLSGGEKQRVVIARALALGPEFLVLDEPTSALDVSVQAKILTILKRLREELGLSYLLITHDLGLMRTFSSQVAVLYLGRIVERGPTDVVIGNALHPYSIALLSATPVVFEEERRLIPKRMLLTSEISISPHLLSGCRFHDRCPKQLGKICSEEEPDLLEVERDHFVRCHLFR